MAVSAWLVRDPCDRGVVRGLIQWFEALQLLDERRALQVQQLRRLSLVAAGALERLLDQRQLDVRDVLLEVEAFVWKRTARRTRPAALTGVRISERQILHLDLRPALAEGNRSLDDVLELPDVARPVIRHQPAHAFLRHRQSAPRPRSAESFCRKCCTRSGISSRRSRSGGSLHRNDVQPVVEILAERTLGDHLREIRMRGGNDADIDLDRVRVADALDLAFLQSRAAAWPAAPGSSSRLRRGRACPCAPARSGPAAWRPRR